MTEENIPQLHNRGCNNIVRSARQNTIARKDQLNEEGRIVTYFRRIVHSQKWAPSTRHNISNTFLTGRHFDGMPWLTQVNSVNLCPFRENKCQGSSKRNATHQYFGLFHIRVPETKREVEKPVHCHQRASSPTGMILTATHHAIRRKRDEIFDDVNVPGRV